MTESNSENKKKPTRARARARVTKSQKTAKKSPQGQTRGRKPKYTVEQVIEALQQSAGIQSAAAQKLRCANSVITAMKAKHPEIQEAIDELEGQTLDLAESQLLAAIKNGEQWAVKFYLQTKGKQRGYTQRIENVGKDGGAIKVSDPEAKASAQQALDELAKLKAAQAG